MNPEDVLRNPPAEEYQLEMDLGDKSKASQPSPLWDYSPYLVIAIVIVMLILTRS